MRSLPDQAAVVGLSARGDVVAQLEKRVKSRFSHRRVLLLELAAEEFADERNGVPALLRALLCLPVRPALLQPCAMRAAPLCLSGMLESSCENGSIAE